MVLPQHKKLARWFYAAHGVTIIIAIGFAVIAKLTHDSEEASVGVFTKDDPISNELSAMNYFVAGTLFVAACIGITAQLRGNRPCLWILYCTIMGIMTLVEISIGGIAISKAVKLDSTVKLRLKDKMELYSDKGQFKNSTVTKNWDKTQVKHECCGIDNYTDWQNVQFGRTSLKVPRSCCKGKLKEDEFCGLNLLPTHENASRLINPKGCLDDIIQALDSHFVVMGAFGLMTSILQLVLVGSISYLMMTKRL